MSRSIISRIHGDDPDDSYLFSCTGHLHSAHRRRFQHLSEHEEFLAEEMNRAAMQDYLRRHEHLTDEQYQHVIAITYDKKANEYLLQLIRQESPEYLQGFKDALRATKQERFISFLP